MAEFVTTTAQRESLGGGQYRNIIGIAPIAYNDGGILRAINPAFIDSGDGSYPHIVTASRLMTSIAPDGSRRIHPTHEIDRYLQVGAPYIKPAATWQQVSLGAPTRSDNLLTWQTTNANVYIQHGGHFAKLAILLKNGWQPPGGQFAFPVDLVGLTRSGGTLLADGVPVMQVRAPHVEDFDNAEDVRAMTWDYVQVNSQWYILFTLPDLTGMSRPLIDPTLELQPDAAAGEDTMIYSSASAVNYGVRTTLESGVLSIAGRIMRSLIRFDISSIPSGSTVDSAQLTFRCEQEDSTTDHGVGAHRALTQFYEGNKNGVAPDPGQDGSTWDLRNANGSVAWAGGAGGAAGSDWVASATDSVSITGTGASFDWDVQADVAAWVAGMATNYGWWIINTDEVTTNSRKWFTSSDGATPANRPKLTVVYTEAAAGGGAKQVIMPGQLNTLYPGKRILWKR